MDKERMDGEDWVNTNTFDGTIDDGGVKIHLLSYEDSHSEISNHPVPFDETPRKDEFETLSLPIDFDGLKDQFASQVAGTLFHDSSRKAQSFLNFHAHIDWIRPYFDVVPADVITRLICSIVPGMRKDIKQGTADLYGPSMVVFTLISILVLTMKNSDAEIEFQVKDSLYVQKDGTLMGAAFGICFTYWWVSALWYFLLSFAMAMEIPFLHILSVSGYSMCGFCLSLLPMMLSLPNVFSFTFFVVFGTLSAASLAWTFYQNSPKQQSGVVAGVLSFLTHIFFLFYLKSLLEKVEIVEQTINQVALLNK